MRISVSVGARSNRASRAAMVSLSGSDRFGNMPSEMNGIGKTISITFISTPFDMGMRRGQVIGLGRLFGFGKRGVFTRMVGRRMSLPMSL